MKLWNLIQNCLGKIEDSRLDSQPQTHSVDVVPGLSLPVPVPVPVHSPISNSSNVSSSFLSIISELTSIALDEELFTQDVSVSSNDVAAGVAFESVDIDLRPGLLLDTGADLSLVFSDILDLKLGWFESISTHSLPKPIKITAAFGHSVFAETYVKFRLAPFKADGKHSVVWLTGYALLLPICSPHGVAVVAGRDFLNTHHYALKQGHHYLNQQQVDDAIVANNSIRSLVNFHSVSLRDQGEIYCEEPDVCGRLFDRPHDPGGSENVQIHELDRFPKNLAKILRKYPALYRQTLSRDVVHTYTVELHDFDYNQKVPFYPMKDPAQKEFLDKFIKDALEAGLIETAKDHERVALAPLFLVPDKSNLYRPVNDYRSVNPSLDSIQLPIKTVAEILESTGGYRWYSKLDIRKAFHNIGLEGDYLGFATSSDRFIFRRLPFGLKVSPAVWVRFINKILKEVDVVQDTAVEIYMDDLVLCAQTQDAMMVLLDNVLNALNRYNLRVKLAKVELMQSSIEFLGYKLDCDGYIPILSDAVKDALDVWQAPSTRRGLQRLLGLTNYLRAHIPRYKELMAPIQAFVSKDSKWNQEIINQNFPIIIAAIKNVVKLNHFNKDLETTILVDASLLGVGAILLQENGVIGYFSKRFNGAQTRYSTTEREFLAIVSVLNAHPHLKACPQLVIHTDHQALTSLNHLKNRINNIRIQKLLDYITGYGSNIVLKYINGDQNMSDIFSRFNIDQQPPIKLLLDDYKWAIFDLNNFVRQTSEFSRGALNSFAISGAVDVYGMNPGGVDGSGMNHSSGAIRGLDTGVEDSRGSEDRAKDNADKSRGAPVGCEDGRGSEDRIQNRAAGRGGEIAVVEDSREPEIPSEKSIIESPFQSISLSDPALNPGKVNFPHYALENLSALNIESIRAHLQNSQIQLSDDLKPLLPYFTIIDNSLKVILENGDEILSVVDSAHFVQVANQEHQSFHGTVQSLHYIMTKLKKLWTPKLVILLQSVVRSCSACDIYQSFKEIPSSLGSYKYFREFSTFSMDFIQLPSSHLPVIQPTTPSRPYRYCLHFIEHSTGYMFGIPALSADSLTVFTGIYMVKMMFPGVNLLICDNGAHFNTQYVKDAAAMFALNLKFGPVYHPMAQGRVERGNQSVKRILKSLVKDKSNFSDWISHYFKAISIYNSTPNLTGFSPFYLAFGIQPSPNDTSSLLSPKDFTPSSNLELQYIPKLLENTHSRPQDNILLFKLDSGKELNAHEVVQEELFYTNIRLAVVRSTLVDARNKNFSHKFAARQMRRLLLEPITKKITYSIGQWVYLRRFKKANKLMPSYVGPFIISKILSPTTYSLRYPDSNESYVPPNVNNNKAPHGAISPLLHSGVKTKELAGVNVYHSKDLRPYYMIYGSPLLSVADLTTKFGLQERAAFKKILDGYNTEGAKIDSLQFQQLETMSFVLFGSLEILLDDYVSDSSIFS